MTRNYCHQAGGHCKHLNYITMKKEKKESAVVRKATYSIEYTVKADGTSALHRKADGFNPFELLGLLDLTRGEIIEQIYGKIKPDVIKREVVGK